MKTLKNSEDPSPLALVPLEVIGTSLTRLSAHPGGRGGGIAGIGETGREVIT